VSPFAENQALALRIARGIGAKLPRNVELGDLEQAAFLGLHEWTTRHPDSSEQGWRGGLVMRVRGAVYDWLRSEDYLKRSTRAKGDLHVVRLEDLRTGDGPGWQDMLELGHEEPDYERRLDRERRLAEMTPAGRYLVDRIAKGDHLVEIARDRLVSPVRITQVVARLIANPRSVTRLPGPPVDLYAELRTFAKAEARRLVAGKTNYRQVALVLGVSGKNWVTGEVSLPSTRGARLQPSPVRDAVRRQALTMVAAAFQRAAGDLPTAARLLTVSQMTAHRWRKLLPSEQQFSRDKRRPELSNASFIELREQGLTQRAIARKLQCDRNTVRSRLLAASKGGACD
jgi:DNA-binding CsgD family transcriptional regulator